jgi:DNA-binding IclR family transcriptional regulator
MPESETLVVYRILGVLAKARGLDHALVLDEIADAARLGRRNAESYMTVLERAGAVRAEATPTHPPGYSLTRYGLERLAGACAR